MRVRTSAAVLLVAPLLAVSACTGGSSGSPASSPKSPQAGSATKAAAKGAVQPVSQRPSEAETLLKGSLDEQAAAAAQALFAAAPVVVVSAADPASLAAAGPLAVKLGVPLLTQASLATVAKPLEVTRAVTVGAVTVPAGVKAVAAPAGTLAVPGASSSTTPSATSSGATTSGTSTSGTSTSGAASTSPTASPTTASPTGSPTTGSSPAASGSAGPGASSSAAPTTPAAPAPVPADLKGDAVAPTSKLGDLTLTAAAAQKNVVVLARPDDAPGYAATATAMAAGATVVVAADPRSTDAAAALAGHGDDPVVAVSTGWDAKTTRYMLQAAAGPELPGGGRLVLDHRYIALYGVPGTGSLGVLGEQDVPATIARAKQVAGQYTALVKPSVVPTLEIIAAVASGTAGPDGNYSQESSIARLTPLIDAAGAAGMYVVLDLQPGRAKLIDLAKLYEPLVKRPYVTLALDPEWKLQPNQQPLKQIGSVSIGEINEVVTYLADLTRDNMLPQKMLLLHQFRLSMIQNRDQLDTSRPELQTVIQMDGQGAQPLKDSTWKTIRKNPPPGVVFGWKNFYDEDKPTLSPALTAKLNPVPWFVSYQ